MGKNILIISTSYFPIDGGQEIGLRLLLNEIQKIDNNITFNILTPRFYKQHKEYEVIDNIKIFRYNSRLIKYPSKIFPKNFNYFIHVLYSFLFISKYLKLIKPDIIITYFMIPSGFASLFFSKKYKIPNIVFLGGSDVFNNNLLFKLLFKSFLPNSKKILVTSNFIKNYLIKNFSINGDKIKNIPYGIDTKLFFAKNKNINEKIKILCVQRLVKSKGVDILIKAIDKIVRNNTIDIFLDIVGDGEERIYLENLVKSKELNNVITFHGNIKNEKIVQYYKNSDIFVFPTLSEGFGIVLLEAMASGNIIIASNCCSIPDIIKDNNNGILFQSGNIDDLTIKLKNVIENIDHYKYLADNAVKDVKQFDISCVAGDLLIELKKIC
ncbi:MAG: glycosyltransferase family 4 protein [Patescibacteria group bacterium]|nr:glycosyltransferase family 4 protein [Patescibacteria group bacterium]